MSIVDIVIVVFVLAVAVVGFERGLVASALPLLGFIGGAALGARIAQALLPDGAESEYAPLVGVLGGVLLGAFVAVALDGLGRALSARLRSRGAFAVVNGAGGAVLLGALGLLLAWAVGAVALHTPGPETRNVREAVQRSTILAALNDALPPSGPLLNVLRRVDPRPRIAGPEARVGPPDPDLVSDPDVRAAEASAVKVVGTACGLGVAASGWVGGPELVVTNAHAVAGEDDTEVIAPDGTTLDAQAVHYDTRNDLALLSVPGLAPAPLGLVADPKRGTAAIVLGYPGNESLTLTPARIGETGEVLSQDSYGRGPVRRSMTPFRGEVMSGNSGGPAVDEAGRVLTTVFAASREAGPPTGLGVPNEVTSRALEGGLRPVDTGPCAA